MYIAIDETELEVKTNSQCMPAADADTKNIALDIYYQRQHLLILNGLIGVYTCERFDIRNRKVLRISE